MMHEVMAISFEMSYYAERVHYSELCGLKHCACDLKMKLRLSSKIKSVSGQVFGFCKSIEKMQKVRLGGIQLPITQLQPDRF